LDILKKVASQFPQYSFGYVPFEGNQDILEEFEVPGNLPQSIVLYNFTNPGEGNIFYLPPNQFESQRISQWIDGIQKGRILPIKYSEPIPSIQYEERIKILVASTFNGFLIDETKDSFIEFNRDKGWSDLNNVALSLKNHSSLQFGKINFPQNDITTFLKTSITCFPTHLLYKRGLKEYPIVYHGELEAESVIRWIEDKLSPIENPQQNKHDEL